MKKTWHVRRVHGGSQDLANALQAAENEGGVVTAVVGVQGYEPPLEGWNVIYYTERPIAWDSRASEEAGFHTNVSEAGDILETATVKS
jgi:hypothetical protein